jgi:geranylgeranyl diphosphate synthase type II
MGAILRGLDARETAAIRSFARHFGLAFQTADDLLDQTAPVEEAGKDVGRDGNIATLVSLLGPGRARLTCQEHLSHAEAALAETRVSPGPIRAVMRRVFAARLASA